MFTLTQAAGLAVLSAAAVWDIRYRKMPVWVLLLLLASAILCRIFLRNVPVEEIAGGMAVGIGFLTVSRVTREAFGYADSILILILGIFLGVWKLFVLLIAAFSLSACYAAGGLLKGKFSGKISFPFIPFLALAYFGVVFFQ